MWFPNVSVVSPDVTATKALLAPGRLHTLSPAASPMWPPFTPCSVQDLSALSPPIVVLAFLPVLVWGICGGHALEVLLVCIFLLPLTLPVAGHSGLG